FQLAAYSFPLARFRKRSDSRSTPDAATSVGSSPSVSARGSASGSGLTKTKGPHESTAPGTSPRLSLSNPGTSSERGAARSEPSRPYVQAWEGHWSDARFPSRAQQIEPA